MADDHRADGPATTTGEDDEAVAYARQQTGLDVTPATRRAFGRDDLERRDEAPARQPLVREEPARLTE